MKVSLYTITLSGGYYDGPAVPLLEIFPKAKSWGYDGIELEAKRPHGNPMDLDRSRREEIRKAADDNGLEISCVSAYNDYSSPIDEHRENELLMTREQIRLAADLGGSLPGHATGTELNGQMVGCMVVGGSELRLCFDGGALNGSADWGSPDTVIRYYVEDDKLIRWNETADTVFYVASNVESMALSDLGSGVQIDLTLTFRDVSQTYTLITEDP